ncbi:flagellar biosynthesis protein FlgL, partial [Rhodobacteraceae bacterium WD3A24]
AGGPALGALEGRVGAAEARVERAAARNSAEATAMESARNDLVGRDPFETASALQETTARLEKIYTVTARLSRLSLLEFLR